MRKRIREEKGEGEKREESERRPFLLKFMLCEILPNSSLYPTKFSSPIQIQTYTYRLAIASSL